MFNDTIGYKVRRVNYDVKNSGNKYTVKDIVDLLPDEVIINLHSGIYDTNLHHISRYSLAERLNSDCSYYKDLVVRDTNLDKDYERPNSIILIIEI